VAIPDPGGRPREPWPSKTVAVVVNTRRRRAAELAQRTAEWLVDGGHQVRIPTDDAAPLGLDKYGCAPDDLGPGADVAVSIGGDGTILRTVGLVAPARVPVLGVSLGRLGYLAHVEPDELTHAFECFVGGDFSLDERLLLRVEVDPGPAPGPGGAARPDTSAVSGVHLALNEAVVEKPSPGQVVRVAVDVDGRFFTSYAADGMIVATPTGSTAYAFSARGPIIAPTHRALLLSPVSPHMAFDRSLVFGPEQSLRLEVLDRPARLIVDGRELGSLDEGASITAAAAEETAKFVVITPPDFYGVLKTKFGLADR
jgi:NAD+ kinase